MASWLVAPKWRSLPASPSVARHCRTSSGMTTPSRPIDCLSASISAVNVSCNAAILAGAAPEISLLQLLLRQVPPRNAAWRRVRQGPQTARRFPRRRAAGEDRMVKGGCGHAVVEALLRYRRRPSPSPPAGGCRSDKSNRPAAQSGSAHAPGARCAQGSGPRHWPPLHRRNKGGC